MKILGIGNAIVDVICKVEDIYLTNNGLTKSTMKLVGESEFKKLLSSLKIEETVSGGSIANSIGGLSQLGNKAGFIGKVNFFDHSKGFGFIIDPETQEKYFVHISECIDEITEGDKVEFDTIRGAKGMNACKVKKV